MVGIKIATLLFVREGQPPGLILDVMGQTRMNVNRWIRAVNKDGVDALIPKKQSGCPIRMTPKIIAQLERHLEDSPQMFGFVLDRRRSREFIEFLTLIDAHYPSDWKLR